jgi:predicted enzyme related to lactoylglutathione lyase
MAPIGGGGPPGRVAPHWSVDFWVDDVDAAVEGAARSGGRVIVAPYDIPGGGMRQAVIADPLGAAFSVTTVTAGDG